MEGEGPSAEYEPKLVASSGIKPDMSCCKICSKPFSNKLSRNRHQLYCRKKHFSGLPNIRKSCAACRRAKVKCNSGFPVCERCQGKDISCVYEKTAKGSKIASGASISLPDREFDNVEDTIGAIEAALDFDVNFDLASEVELNVSFENINDNSWEFDNTLASRPTPHDSGYSENSSLVSPSHSSWWLEHFVPNSAPNTQLSSTFDFSFQPDIANFLIYDSATSESMFEGPYLMLRYIERQHGPVSRMSAVACRVSPFVPAGRPATAAIGHNFLLQNLKAYPALLLDDSCLTPFIHNSAVAAGIAGSETSSESEHLKICKSIMQMYQAKTPQTKGFIWRSVETERQRFFEIYDIADEQDAFSMLQAITIYILLRIFDDDTFTIEFDTELIKTMTLIAIQLEQSGFLCPGEVHGYRPGWKDWIQMESKRRTVITLFLIHLLFDISPGQRGKALAGLSVLPLPATKKMWHAKTEEEWQALYDEMLLKRQGRRYLSYADLVFLGSADHASHGEDLRIKDLHEWYAALDGFGVLVMMAATTF